MSDRFDTYEAALDYLTKSTDYERMRRVRYNADTFSLERMNALLDALGRPERLFRSVHIAGTKGKGSTAAMIEAILRRHGLRTGLYTSPHLVDMRERIQIDRQWISQDAMRRHIGSVAVAVEARLAEDVPTYFEQVTAVAFLAFAEARVDVAVVEVGLGGRLDATNVLKPAVAVITSLSMDHTQQLGDTLTAIAREKAGIIKLGIPAVVAPQAAEAATVVRGAAQQLTAPLIEVDKDVTWTWAPAFVEGGPASRVTVRTPRSAYEDLRIPLAGRVQGVNTACAVAAAEVILGDRLDPRKLRAGFADVDWAGRMQAFPGDVTVILDGAHNADSMEKLMEAVRDYYPRERVVWLFACAADKDVAGMLTALARAGAEVVFTRTETARAAEPRDLATQYEALGGRVLGRNDSPAEATATARRALSGRGLIVICGSLYLVGEALAAPDRFGLAGRGQG